MSDQEILSFHRSVNHRCSRIDLAIDVRGDDVDLDGLQNAIDTGQFDDKGHKISEVKSVNGHGYTLYVGSRTSDRFLRIYDKQAESGGDEGWIRFEVELKRKVADAAFERLCAEGLDVLPDIARGIIGRMVSVHAASFDAAMTGPCMVTMVSKDTDRKTRKWLLETCAKALVRYHLEHPGEDVYGQFRAVCEGMMPGWTPLPPI